MLANMLNKDRPLRDVPRSVLALLLLTLSVQVSWHSQQDPIVARAEDLPSPLSARAYTISSFGEPVATARLLNLWLQAFDNQPGASISFNQLDYSRIADWLDVILELDPRGRYPMLVAARVYGSITDPVRKRYMMEYIFYKFKEDPAKHWPWLAHAVITAKHELKDMDLALKYASALSEQARRHKIPYWASDMKIIVLEDMGEVEAAKVLVGGLLETGDITDEYELNFLTAKIRVLEEKSSKMNQDVE
jgi:hypothetical protein